MRNFCLALRDQGVGGAVTTLLCLEDQGARAAGDPRRVAHRLHLAVGYPAKGFPRKLTRSAVEEIVSIETSPPMFS